MSTAISGAPEAFSIQAAGYDANDMANPVLPKWRRRVYKQVERYLGPASRILELNAGTGIDASYFVQKGHYVHATDASPGMLDEIQKKIITIGAEGRFTSQLLPFDQVGKIQGPYHHLFSNFGGLNCLQNLRVVTGHIPNFLRPDGYVTWVIMPPFCPWELTWVLKGKFRMAFRRLQKDGTEAHLLGHHFKTYYHSLNEIQKALGPCFRPMAVEGLGSFSPPPAAMNFVKTFPGLSRLLELLDERLCGTFPFNRCADHIIVTFQYQP